jgi:polyphosphate kinase 2 (PPK2 family)
MRFTQVEQFFRDVPEFERMLVRPGILLLKYWFSISDEEQRLRFLMRIHGPTSSPGGGRPFVTQLTRAL